MAASACIDLPRASRNRLLAIARQLIHCGLEERRALAVEPTDNSDPLSAEHGVFVTLTQRANLRGCIGSLEGVAPLAQAVADAAYSAAFRDPRFPALAASECTHTRIEISVLSAMESLAVTSRAHLLEIIVPGQDGLVLEDGYHRSTFLPKVWEQLPEPEAFLAQLLLKAGLAPDHWSSSIRLKRYTTLSFADEGGAGCRDMH
jgi:AmmeMemoRadiSam system protein A